MKLMRSVALAGVSVGAVVAACGGGGSPLAFEPEPDQGTGGEAPTTTTETPTSVDTGEGGIMRIDEPAVDPNLTVVNGVVDYGAVRICFQPADGSANANPPWPASGLAYGRGEVAPPPSADAEAFDVVAITGDDLAPVTGSCDEVVAAPPASIFARVAGRLPASVLTAERSVLVALYGCAGGPGHEDPTREAQICGAGYTPDTGNVGSLAGFMSQIRQSGRVSVQVAHASAGLADSVPSFILSVGSPGLDITDRVSLGAVAPFPPNANFSAAELNPDVGTAFSVEVIGGFAGESATIPLSAIFGAGPPADNEGSTFVLLGPNPEAGTGPWWNPFTVAVVASSPSP